METRYSGREYQNYVQAIMTPLPGEVPLSPVGNWINEVLIPRELTLGEANSLFCTNYIDALRKRDAVTLSADTFARLFEGATAIDCNEVEIGKLTDIIADAYERKMARKEAQVASKAASKIQHEPPKEIPQLPGLITDIEVARAILGEGVPYDVLRKKSYNVRTVRNKMGIVSPYSMEEARRIAAQFE